MSSDPRPSGSARRVVPMLSFGTYRMKGDELRSALRAAIDVGYRSIDTAQVYKNEADVGAALGELFAAGVVARGDVFVTSKISPRNAGEKAYQSILDSLQRLNFEYIDLMLIHWPGSAGLPPNSAQHAARRRETWRALERAHAEGLVRHIGVSNFTERHVEELCGYAAVAPAVNQIEFHPLHIPHATLAACASHGIQVQGYSPLGEGRLVVGDDATEPAAAAAQAVIRRVAAASSATAAQVLLRWAVEWRGVAVVVKTRSAERARENFVAMAALDGITAEGGVPCTKYCWDPSGVA
ncbi:NADP-dependent oxidoreductase domain-containing protein [Zopfochytrium polystomum]|nr:NADP-dependent oxidoreductase domain-containing protein [Zopfochytrium polystomum]